MKYMEHGEQFNDADGYMERTPDPFAPEPLSFESDDLERGEEHARYESPGEIYDALGDAIVDLDKKFDPRLLSLVNE